MKLSDYEFVEVAGIDSEKDCNGEIIGYNPIPLNLHLPGNRSFSAFQMRVPGILLSRRDRVA